MSKETFIRFERNVQDPKRKTKTWQVLTLDHTFLGYIKWFGRWRCYGFFPNAGTI